MTSTSYWSACGGEQSGSLVVTNCRRCDWQLHVASVESRMAIVLNINPSKQRCATPDEMVDDQLERGDYFGTTSDRGAQVWHFDGLRAVRVGIPDPDERSMTTLQDGEGVRQALQRVPMFAQTHFVLHRMKLPPGAYYSRMSRPSDQHPTESPGMLPDFWKSSDLIASTLNQVRSLVGMLDTIFQAVHPAQANMTCYGSSIRNLLILACTECEAQWRGILGSNGLAPERPSTRDYVKLASAMRLSDYSIKLQHYPWLDEVAPFQTWEADAPTKSIAWYDDYNAAKHDREAEFDRASLGSAIHAVAAVWVMIAAQFGINGVREFDDLRRYFQLERVPLWRYSEVYTHPYGSYETAFNPQHYPF